MMKTNSIFASLFTAAVVGVSAISPAADRDPFAMNPLDQPAPVTMEQTQTRQPVSAPAPQPQQRRAVQMQTPAPAQSSVANQQPVYAQPQFQKQQTQASGVIVNEVALSMDVVSAMRAAGMNVVEGDYWYDRACGAFGYKGGPLVGLIAPGLNLGGPLKADCSNGTSGMFINGRELTMGEALPLAQALRIGQGRYALDRELNFGYEGQAPAINLRQLAQAAQQQQQQQAQQQQQQPERHKSLSERGLLYSQPLVVPGVGASGEGFSYTHD